MEFTDTEKRILLDLVEKATWPGSASGIVSELRNKLSSLSEENNQEIKTQ